MKGDKGGISRGEKLFQKISQGDKFKKGVEEIRRQNIISDFGFSYKEYIRDWYGGTTLIPIHRERFNKFKEQIDRLLRQSALPLNSWWRHRVITFIISGDKMSFLPKLHDFQQPFVELINHHVSRDGSYNDIRIYERATQDDVRDFVSKNWKQIRPSYRVGTLKKVRKENPKDIEINREAVELMRMSKKELGTRNIKEITISKHLSKKYGKGVSSDAVKARTYRTKNKKG